MDFDDLLQPILACCMPKQRSVFFAAFHQLMCRHLFFAPPVLIRHANLFCFPLITILMGAQLLMAEERLAQNQSTEVVDAFRLFISGKQYFKEMIINDPYLLSDSKTKVNRYYRIGWQSNTWFIEEIEPSNDERTSWQRKVNLYGVAFDKVWSVGNLAVTFADRDDKRLWAGVSTNSIENTVGFQRAWPLSLFITCGLLWVPPNTIVWENSTRFSAERWTPSGNIGCITNAIVGTIDEIGGNGPTKITYRPISTPSTNYILRYTYSRILPKGLPSGWSWSVEVNGYTRYSSPEKEILSATFGDQDLSSSGGYVPSLFNNIQRQYIVFYTNSTMFQMDRNAGQFIQTPANDPAAEIQRSRKRILLFVAAVFFVVLLLILLRVRARNAMT